LAAANVVLADAYAALTEPLNVDGGVPAAYAR
jgi:hypothetical protein